MAYTREDLQQMIGAEETFELDFKAAGSLDKSDEKKRIEITKDVSGLANAAGGKLIYGIGETKDKEGRGRAARLDLIDRSKFPTELLEQIIGQIRPALRYRIFPVLMDEEQKSYCYVVEVPQGDTAHQARDQRYYRRRNTDTTPMEDYEVREVMNRRKDPKLSIKFWLERNDQFSGNFHVQIDNIGKVIARDFAAEILMPMMMDAKGIKPMGGIADRIKQRDVEHWQFTLSNAMPVNAGPLFPGSSRTLSHPIDLNTEASMKFYPAMDLRTLENFAVFIYADEMEKIEVLGASAKVSQGVVISLDSPSV